MLRKHKLSLISVLVIFYTFNSSAVEELVSTAPGSSPDYLRIICELEQYGNTDPSKFEVIVIEQTSTEIKSGTDLIENGFEDIISDIPAQLRVYRGEGARMSRSETPEQNLARLQALEPSQYNENQNYNQSNFVRVDGVISTAGNRFEFFHQNPSNHRRLSYTLNRRTNNALSNHNYDGVYRCLDISVFTRPNSNTQSDEILNEEQMAENIIQ